MIRVYHMYCIYKYVYIDTLQWIHISTTHIRNDDIFGYPPFILRSKTHTYNWDIIKDVNGIYRLICKQTWLGTSDTLHQTMDRKKWELRSSSQYAWWIFQPAILDQKINPIPISKNDTFHYANINLQNKRHLHW